MAGQVPKLRTAEEAAEDVPVRHSLSAWLGCAVMRAHREQYEAGLAAADSRSPPVFERRKASPAGKAAEDGGFCGCQETAFFRRLESEVNHINK